ncbi:Flp pilus assembly protein CpaB [Nocardiopsis sp. L17-MgMaSL7]|uniref:Flp pilus assembly protein CpaB n=1 Tax=Nocardiopsis sp. L17-MgMaSL7 TaxID=1938893 RepID=UPI000D7188F9|nr:Flp pilus assembly protein CpaB [Nocardiopsis sp. L17-MgMaSL7]PWV58150.1 pilus assembly protein CpaB [Nocardiopsis sp. L17-MgMaSL7]
MNPRQRRGVLLMVVAAIGAVAVFASVFTYLNSQQDQVGRVATVLELVEDVDANQPLGQDSYTTVEVPASYFDPEVFISDLDEIETPEGQELVAASHLTEGSILQHGMVKPQPTLTAGEREIAIMVNAETGIAGKVQRGSVVDIYGTFQARDHGEACATRIVTEVEVLDIGELRSQESEAGGVAGVVPVTFRLDPQTALQLAYAEEFASKLRMGLVSAAGGGDPGDTQVCSGDFEGVFENSGGGSGSDEQSDQRRMPHEG